MFHELSTKQYFIICYPPDGYEVDSPQNVCAPRHHVPSPDLTQEEESPVPQVVARKSRFAALAANINSWEDDTNHPVHKKEEVRS